jgi:hypothetical protein
MFLIPIDPNGRLVSLDNKNGLGQHSHCVPDVQQHRGFEGRRGQTQVQGGEELDVKTLHRQVAQSVDGGGERDKAWRSGNYGHK